MADFGAWSLLPPALAIVFAMATRKVYQSLLLGIVIAGVMVAGSDSFANGSNVVAASLSAVAGGFILSVEWLIAGVANRGHAGVIAFTLFLGALVALMQRSGGVRGFGELALRYASTRRRGQFATAFIGSVFLAIDDYFHVIAAGSVFRPLTDRLKISREKLAYLIDSTAAPMVILVPVSTWAGFIISTIGESGIDRPSFQVFLEAIPYNFYALLTVTMVFIIALSRMEYGPMRVAERRAAVEGKVLRDGARPLVSKELAEMEMVEGATPRARNLALPVLFLIPMALLMMYATGRAAGGTGFRDAIFNAQAELALAVATFLTLLFAMVLYTFQGLMKQDEFMDTTMDGFKAMMPALAILALAWGIANATDGVGLGPYLAGEVGSQIDIAVLPLVSFLAAAIIAFATGTSFGTFAIMIPITLAIASGDPDGALWFGPVLAASIGGAVFGDHCSPISDTTVLSSMAAQSDHIDHVRTQLPYALTVAAIAAAGYGLLALTGSIAVAWIVNLVLLGAVAAFGILTGRHPDPAPVVDP